MPPKAASPVAAPPQIMMRYRERVERLDCPDVYAGDWLDVWTNPPDRLVAESPDDGALLVAVIRAWSFETTAGQPAPITVEALAALPRDLVYWIIQEWITRRTAPLASRISALAPNGTLSTAASNGTA